MYKPQFGLLQGNYVINDYSYGYLYKESFKNKEFQSWMWDSGSKGLQMAVSTYFGVKTTPQSGSKLIDIITITGKASIDYNEPNPTSVGNVDSLNPYDNESLERAQKKMEKINSSPYKYVIYDSSARKKFIKELDNQIGKIRLQDIDSDRYRQTMINYIESIKNININYKQSEKDIKYLIQ